MFHIYDDIDSGEAMFTLDLTHHVEALCYLML